MAKDVQNVRFYISRNLFWIDVPCKDINEMVFISINLYTVKPVVHDTRVDCFPVLSETDFFAIF